MTKRGYGRSLATFAFLLLTVACAKDSSDTVVVPSFPPTDPGPPELPYCSTAKTYSSAVTITGHAKYEYRTHYGTENSGGLGIVQAVPRPIRYAEVRVLNSAGAVAQCATTDANGDFSFTLPTGTANYTIQVNSRSKNSRLNATVFDLPENKVFYSLTKTVKPNVSKDVGTMLAHADGDVKAGAYNILDQLLNSNEYLRSQVGTGLCNFTGCVEFTVSPKIEVFWKKGFNPGSYFDSGPLSFYLPGYGRLFILGGVNGDVDHTDTDHFDNSVIIHEFGHFLEDQMLVSDSPGGPHNGNKIIDPRLAWSEGWGNFLQAAVQNSAFYIDTIGNIDGDTEFAFYIGLETAEPSKDYTSDGANGSAGEGIFREFSVTRLLWDAIDTNHDFKPPLNVANEDTIDNRFPEIWAALSKNSGGWRDANAEFRNIGWLHVIQKNLELNESASNWDDIRAIERHVANQSEYAEYVTTSGCGSYGFSITPQSVSGDAGALSTSDLFRNNDFYHYYASSNLSNVKFRLAYKDADAAGAEADLDFYLYNTSAQFGFSDDIIGSSRKEPTGAITTTQTETISVSSLAKGHYLLNVFVYTGNGSIGGENDYNLQISINGGSWTNLCASPVP